jgi:hypothetical protein
MNKFKCQVIAETACRLPEGQVLELKQFTAAGRPVDVRIATSYRDAGFTSHLPVYLSFDCTLEGSDLDDAVNAALLTAAVLLPAIAFAANASYQDPAVLVAYDDDPSQRKHVLRFDQLFPAENPFAGGREIQASTILNVVDALIANDQGERLHRSMVFYNEALLAWRPGAELRAVESLFVVAETLKTVALQSYQKATGLTDEGLGQQWQGVIAGALCPRCKERWTRRGDLESAARLKLVFNDRADVHTLARRVSDGLEHGFRDLPSLQTDARKCRDDTASLVRQCLIRLLCRDEETAQTLLSAPFDRPRRRDDVQCQTRMVLNGSGGCLAPAGHLHPVIEVERTIKDVVLRSDGSADVTRETPMTFRFAEGVTAENIGMRFGSRATAVEIKEVSLKRGREDPTAEK